MLRLTELKLPLDHPPDALRDAVLTRLAIPADDLLSLTIARRAYDARRRSAIHLVYAVDVTLRDEPAVLCALPQPPPHPRHPLPLPRPRHRPAQPARHHRHRPLWPDGRPHPRPNGFSAAHPRARPTRPRNAPRTPGPCGAAASSTPNPTSSSARAAPAPSPTASSTPASKTPATSPANSSPSSSKPAPRRKSSPPANPTSAPSALSPSSSPFAPKSKPSAANTVFRLASRTSNSTPTATSEA